MTITSIESQLEQFKTVAWKDVRESEAYIFDAVGGRTQTKFLAGIGWKPGQATTSGLFGPVMGHEEIFEWLDLVTAVRAASGSFCFVELGCGYGRWTSFAHWLLAQLNPMPATWIGVEAEPTHFIWACEHARDNGYVHQIHEVAVGGQAGTSLFYVGDADSQYGQAMAPSHAPRDETKEVTVVTLATLLQDVARVDLIDCDIQGHEYEVMAASSGVLNSKVARVHIGTHAHDVEDGLRKFFSGLGWQSVHDYPCASTRLTPTGEITFTDGVQSWVNPVLARK